LLFAAIAEIRVATSFAVVTCCPPRIVAILIPAHPGYLRCGGVYQRTARMAHRNSSQHVRNSGQHVAELTKIPERELKYCVDAARNEK
jgi:hypothetical protein